MSEQIIAKLDEIEAQTVAKIEESKQEAVKLVDEKVASFEEKVAHLEAKISEIGATPVIKTYKTVSQEVNRSVKEISTLAKLKFKKKSKCLLTKANMMHSCKKLLP
jgi:cell fate (sporulation/competence/biofilm development) regulator YmcA (YheA/YmcA/DUF963 family)